MAPTHIKKAKTDKRSPIRPLPTRSSRAAKEVFFRLLQFSLEIFQSIWRWLAPSRADILQPYVRRPAKNPLIRFALVLSVLIFCFIYGFAFAIFAPAIVVPFFLPLVILALLAVWALPQSARPPTNWLTTLFVVFSLTMVLWPSYIALSLTGLPRMTFLRIIGVPMNIFFLICMSSSPLFRKQLSLVLSKAKFLCINVILFLIIQTISLLYSINISISVNIYLNMIISWYGAFFVGCFIFSRQQNQQHFVELLCLTALTLSLIGLWEYHLQKLPWVGHIPSFLRIDDPIVERILAGTSRGQLHRVQGTFTTSLGLSEYLGLSMPFLLYLLIARRPLWVKISSMATIPIVIYVTVLTQSRTGLLGVIIAFLLYPLLNIILLCLQHRRSITASVTLFLSPLVPIAGVTIALVVPGIRIRLLGGGASVASNLARVEQWHMGIPKILRRPWGYGVGQGAQADGWTNAAGGASIDSYPLRLILEYGFIGLIIYYAFNFIAIISLGRDVMRRGSNDNHAKLSLAIGVAIVSYAAMQVNYAQEDNEPLMFILYSLVVGMLFSSRPSSSGRTSDTTPLSLEMAHGR